jgi:hypothetical protein
MIVRIGQSTTHLNNWAGRLAAKESLRKSRSIRRHPGQKFSDMIAPLENQLEPKPGKDRESSK